VNLEDPALASLFPTSDAIPEAVRIDPRANPPRMLIDGRVQMVDDGDPDRWVPIYSRVGVRVAGDVQPVLIGHEPKVGPLDVAEAMAAAERALASGNGAWPTAPVGVRIAAVETFAAKLAANVDRIATLLMWEIGKPIASARQEVTRSVAYIEDTIVHLRHLDQERAPYTGIAGKTTHHARNVTRPLGTVLCVAPFNYPINEFLTTIIPALLMGNVVIAKTPRFGMLANQALMDAFAEAFPPGVVALLPGDGRIVLPAVISHKTNDVFGNPKGTIDVFAFIGSEGAANAILSRHPTPSFVHKILGLGAKNAAVVLPGADVETVATRLVRGALGFNGQRCTAEKIVFAPAGAEGDALVAAIASKVAKLPLGMPWDPAAAITPLPEPQKLEVMWSLISDAVERGAAIANEQGGRGFYSIMRPAVLDRVAVGMKIFDEEQFGPIVPVARYTRLDEVIEWHVRSPYGQQAGVHGPGSAEQRALVGALASFVARINLDDVCQRGPDTFGFTAADKSGFGTLSIDDALRAFSRSVIVQSPDRQAIDRI
jgi:glyceraldehyde-3-phosphate dehydrogenase (NADP+)